MIPFGKETEEKIARHRKLRAGKGFETIECYTDLKKAAEILQTKETGSVLLECMSNLVANEMYDPSGAGENAEESILAGIHKLQKVSDAKSKQFCQRFIGDTLSVLFEQTMPDNISDGHTGNYIKVYTDKKAEKGEIRSMKMLRIYKDGLWGENLF